MSSIAISGDTSGAVTIAAPAIAGTNTMTLVAGTGSLAPKVLSTAVTATSGTSIDFTNIPSWVTRITVMFSGVSLSGTANKLIQFGTGGIPTTSGYTASANYISNIVGSTIGFTAGFGTTGDGIATSTTSGNVIFTNISGNTWVGGGVLFSPTPTNLTIQIAGLITLSGTLNLVRVTSTNGTDTFDAGTINIMYE